MRDYYPAYPPEYDAPDIVMIKEKTVKARKRHPCYLCCTPIEVGESYRYFAYLDEYNKFHSDHGHIYCPMEE